MKAKFAALVAVIASAILIPAALLAWGPSRTTYTMDSPADHVVFNSIVGNPKAGDEQNFVGIREANTGAQFTDNVQLQAGKEYEVSVFYHNNASSSLNDAAHDYKGIAHKAYMRVQMPGIVKAGDKARVTGFVGAENASPSEVWDDAYGAASQDLALRYVAGSAKISNLGNSNGSTMPNSLFTDGTPLGFDSLNGDLPGCNHYEGWVFFRFKAVAPDFEVTKTVEKLGTNSFAKSVTVNPSDTVEYKIQYKNTGSITQNNVVVKDVLPKGVTYVPGTTNVANPGSNGKWVAVADNNVVTNTGLNIGNYGPSSNAYVSFKAKVADAKDLVCGTNKLTNTVTVETDNGAKSDTADVIVNKPCINVCEKSTNKIITIDEKDFDNNKHSKNLSDCKGQTQVCELTSGKVITIDAKDFDSKKHTTNLSACNTTTVELPRTGISTGVMSILGLGALTAGATYASTSSRIRNLLRR